MIQYNAASDTTYPMFGVGDPATLVQLITYEQFVTNLIKERGSLGPNLEHMVIGVCGEAGELADAIKKHTIYGKELDMANVMEELGDLEFYIAGLRQMLAIKRDEVLQGNFTKLQKRYNGSYSDEAAQTRADKLPEATTPPAGCTVIDVTSAEYKAANPAISQEQVDAVDEQAVVVQAWCVPLLEQFHPGKVVQAIAYTNNTATVLFVGDSNPYKLYKPK